MFLGIRIVRQIDYRVKVRIMLTTDIFYLTDKTETYSKTNTQTETDPLPQYMYRIWSRYEIGSRLSTKVCVQFEVKQTSN